jgi:octaprenyl-diphosphate synthase
MSSTIKNKNSVKTWVKQVQHDLEPYWSQLNQNIKSSLNSSISTPESNKILTHLLNNQGKRIRPLVTLLIPRALNLNISSDHITMATVIELTHTATLLHDDVIDESLMRRNKQTANSIWGSHAPILAGDFIYSRAIQLMVQINNQRIMKILAAGTNQLIEGELIQLINTNSFITYNEYIDTIYRKTAIMFECACECSAIQAEAEETTIQHCKQFGKQLGIIFQIVDDILDYTADNETLGKNTGDDIKQGKFTLPLINAINTLPKTEQDSIIHDIQQKKISFEQINSLIKSSEAIEKCYQEVRDRQKIATEHLQALPQNIFTQHLQELLEFNTNRVN